MFTPCDCPKEKNTQKKKKKFKAVQVEQSKLRNDEKEPTTTKKGLQELESERDREKRSYNFYPQRLIGPPSMVRLVMLLAVLLRESEAVGAGGVGKPAPGARQTKINFFKNQQNCSRVRRGRELPSWPPRTALARNVPLMRPAPCGRGAGAETWTGRRSSSDEGMDDWRPIMPGWPPSCRPEVRITLTTTARCSLTLRSRKSVPNWSSSPVLIFFFLCFFCGQNTV